MKDSEQRELFTALERKIEASARHIATGEIDHIAHLEAQQREVMMGLGNIERKLDERFVPQARTDAQNIKLHEHLERIDKALKDRAFPALVLPSPRVPMIAGMGLGVALFVAGLWLGYVLK